MFLEAIWNKHLIESSMLDDEERAEIFFICEYMRLG